MAAVGGGAGLTDAASNVGEAFPGWARAAQHATTVMQIAEPARIDFRIILLT
jgi:hypothetical protein